MSKKQNMLLIRIPDDETEQTLKDALDKSNVERGLIMRADIGKEIFKHFELVAEKGYFPVGMILEDGFNIEFLFQRHPKQTKKMKMVEMKPLNKYKV